MVPVTVDSLRNILNDVAGMVESGFDSNAIDMTCSDFQYEEGWNTLETPVTYSSQEGVLVVTLSREFGAESETFLELSGFPQLVDDIRRKFGKKHGFVWKAPESAR